ncbi:flagellar biosynthesis protein [Geothermobacter ehrlichii]|uniref:Flagellar biosynthesis protein n=1 Tax=Geothermobacter ehrlichii TaxID=213224 RepID=A0A5D3WLX7_9BACT|nr:EscU/YscU/HrcU family type III secretion system export apparatus switch protein [Geothermobacter ehrlichii]TYP00166.1 flagellar biosynthesis protein [Geothermobacter ehrlichii]
MTGQANEHLATALRYDPKKDRAPKIVATGRGELARRIIQAAENAGVPIVADGDLVEVLARMPLDTEIPEDLYQAVAEVLAFVYRLNRCFADSTESPQA